MSGTKDDKMDTGETAPVVEKQKVKAKAGNTALPPKATTTKASNKRKAQDDAGGEQKRPNLDPKYKKNVLKWIVACHLRVMNVIGADESHDLHLGTQITSAITTTHNILRQLANQTEEGLEAKAKNGFMLKWAGKQHHLPLKEMKDLVNETALQCKLAYTKVLPDQVSWYSTAAPYLTFAVGFNQRLKEIRAGHNSLPIPDNTPASEKYKYNIKNYGFNPAHSVLMDGITFAPEKKGSIAQSLGVGTALIQVYKTKDQSAKFRDKWAEAVKRDLKHIPEIDKIVLIIPHSTPEDAAALMGKLADTALVLGNRSIHRAYFPAIFVCKGLFTAAERKAAVTRQDGHEATQWPRWAPLDINGTPLLSKCYFSQSGPGAYECYRLATEGATFLMPKTCSADIMQQATFHAIWGTFCEDLSILSFVTSRKVWGNRGSFGKFLDKYGTTEERLEFDFPRMEKGCKLASANMYAPDNNGERTVMINCVFAGKRFIPIKESMIEYFKRNNSFMPVETTRNAGTYTRMLQNMIDMAVEKWRQSPTLSLGTVDWKSAETEEGHDAEGKPALVFKEATIEPPMGKMHVFY